MARNGSFAVEKLRIEFQRLEQVGRLTPVLDVLKARDTPKLKDVTKCYRRLAAQIHPDKGGRGGDKQRATSAFQVLTRAHDQALHAALFDAPKLEENLNTGKMFKGLQCYKVHQQASLDWGMERDVRGP